MTEFFFQSFVKKKKIKFFLQMLNNYSAFVIYKHNNLKIRQYGL